MQTVLRLGATVHRNRRPKQTAFGGAPATRRFPKLYARGCSKSALAPVVHGNRAIAERLRQDQLEPSCSGHPALVQGRAVACDPGVHEQLVLVD